MKLISLNVEINRHYELVFALFRKENPDVVCLQEVLEEDVELFKKELNMQCVFRVFDYVRHDKFEGMQGKRQGVAIFTRNIADAGAEFYFGSEENIQRPFEEFMSKEIYGQNSALAWVDVEDSDGKVFKFITTHLPVTRHGESSPYQLAVVDELIKFLKNIPNFIICGDMNAPRGGETFGRLHQIYKDDIPISYKTSIDQNLHRVKGLQYVVDCLFTTPGYAASDVRLVDGVSDHMAIAADIQKLA